MGIHRTGPCLASRSVEGGAGLQDVVGGLKICGARTFVWMGNFQSVEVGEELTVSSYQSKDYDVSYSVQSDFRLNGPGGRECKRGNVHVIGGYCLSNALAQSPGER